VDQGSPTPAYLQLAEIIRGRIAAGEWSRGPLPSNRAFQETYDVGEYVVTRAIRLLEDEGLVFTVPRRGVYVRRQGLPSVRSPSGRAGQAQAPGLPRAGSSQTTLSLAA
jgi:GntR family transcriptional regulator